MVNMITGLQVAIVLLSLILFIQAKIIREQAVISEKLNPVKRGYVVDGHIEIGDFAALLPYWTKQGIIDLQIHESKLTLVKKKELPEESSKEETILFQEFFSKHDSFILGLPQTDLLKSLRSAKIALIDGFEGQGMRIFTKVSMRNKGIISFLLFLSILLQSFTVLKEIRDYSPAMEEVTFVVGVLGISSAVYVTIRNTIKMIRNKEHKSTRWVYLAFLLLLLQYIGAIGIVLFLSIYLKSLFFVAVSACIAYIFLSLSDLFIEKRTETNRSMEQFSIYTDILFAETNDLIQDTKQCQEMYELLKTIKLVWNDADKMKLPGNNIPVHYN